MENPIKTSPILFIPSFPNPILAPAQRAQSSFQILPASIRLGGQQVLSLLNTGRIAPTLSSFRPSFRKLVKTLSANSLAGRPVQSMKPKRGPSNHRCPYHVILTNSTSHVIPLSLSSSNSLPPLWLDFPNELLFSTSSFCERQIGFA
jgi:hypothetical protein